MAKQTRNYRITETIARAGNGTQYSQIEHPTAIIEVTIPEEANPCLHPETGEAYYTFASEIGGGTILVQAYGAEIGEAATFELFVREKLLPGNKGGWAFLYCKLVKTDQPANAEAEVVSGAYLADLRKWNRLGECTLIDAPQHKHDGAVIILSAGLELPDVDTLIAETSKPKRKKWKTVRRNRRKTRAAG